MQQYQLTRQINEGGMGRVYAGRKLTPLDTSDIRPVAVKVVPPRDLEEEERQAAALFQREAVLSWQISHEHPNLVTTYDYGISANQYRYLVMEMVQGVSLRDLTHEREPLAHHVIRRIVIDVLSGLAHLHKRDVMHRDISRRNILISRKGEVKLADFGLIKASFASGSGCFRGTEQYAAPEQLRGLTLTPLSDLYSIGVLLYQLLSGAYPYGKTGHEVIHAAVKERAPDMLPPDAPADLADVAYGLIELTPGKRAWTKANEVLAFIREQGQQVATADELAQVVAERSGPDGTGEHSTTSMNHLPALGWPFAEMEAKAAQSKSSTSGAQFAPPAKKSKRARWLPWALLPVAFAAGLVVFWLGAFSQQDKVSRSEHVADVMPVTEPPPQDNNARNASEALGERMHSPSLICRSSSFAPQLTYAAAAHPARITAMPENEDKGRARGRKKRKQPRTPEVADKPGDALGSASDADSALLHPDFTLAPRRAIP